VPKQKRIYVPLIGIFTILLVVDLILAANFLIPVTAAILSSLVVRAARLSGSACRTC